MLIVTGYEASEDKVYKEPLLTDPDEPPPAPVMLAEPAPVATVTLEGSEPAFTEYPEPGQPGRTGGLVSDWLFVGAGCGLVAGQYPCVYKAPETLWFPNNTGSLFCGTLNQTGTMLLVI